MDVLFDVITLIVLVSLGTHLPAISYSIRSLFVPSASYVLGATNREDKQPTLSLTHF